MAKGKTTKDKVAKVAAAAAAAAVKASTSDESGRVLFFSNDEVDDDDDDELADEVMQGLAQIDESAAGDITWWELYCDTPLEKAGQIRKLSTGELKGLRDECLALGPGEYHVVARSKRGTFVKGSKQRIKISGFARAATATNPSPQVDPFSMMAQMEERLERRRLSARAERNAEIKFWAPIFAPIGIELAKGLFGRGSGESIKDLVAALVGMKDLMGAGAGDKQVDTLLKGIELARDLEPGSSKGSTWPDVLANGLSTLAKPLADSLAQRRGATTNGTQLQFQPAAAPNPNAPAGAIAPPANPQEQTPEKDAMWVTIVEPLLQRLVQDLEEFAVNGADPALAAEALLAKIPRSLKSTVQPEQVKQWLTDPEWWTRLVSFRTSLAPYQAFCDDVRLSILEQLEPPEDDNAQTEASA